MASYFGGFLKQSTAVTVNVGPFEDPTDGSAETGLTIAQSDCLLTKNGGAAAQKNASGGGTHDAGGNYTVSLSTTDTGTLGRLRLAIAVAGARPVTVAWQVVPENVWDSLVGGTASLQVNATTVPATVATSVVLQQVLNFVRKLVGSRAVGA